jgi:signal transduction histidine kinase
VWIVTAAGVAIVDPRRVPGSAAPPRPLIERVAIDGVVVEADGLVLPARTRTLEIRYTAPALGAPERLRFRHRLDPFDRGWIEAGPRRQTTYTSLAPGQYRFLVQVAGEDGVHGDPTAALAFEQRSHLHQRPWFWPVLAGLAAALGLAAHRARTRLIRRELLLVLAERSRIARELHDTLLQGMVGITLQLEGFAARLDGAGPLREPFTRLLDSLRQAVQDARDSITDLRSGDAGTLLPERLSEVVSQAAAGSSLEPHVHVTGGSAPLPAEVETELLRIAQEAVTNSLRHARARTLHVGLSLGHRRVTLRVRDDGQGFDPAAPAPDGHFGLLGLRERAARIGARVDVRSAPGRGTEIAVIWRAA